MAFAPFGAVIIISTAFGEKQKSHESVKSSGNDREIRRDPYDLLKVRCSDETERSFARRKVNYLVAYL